MIGPRFSVGMEAGAASWLRSQLAPSAQLSADSRRVQPGDGFLAFAGARSDGRSFIEQAVALGAGAVLFDTDEAPVIPAGRVPLASFDSLRRQAGAVSSHYYGVPSASMQVVGFTGTNGKTSCANWCAAGLVAHGPTAAIGTLGITRYNDVAGAAMVAVDAAPDEAVLTTPDAVSLQRELARLRDQGVHAVALEASSIGLAQARLCGTEIDVAVFTNLTRDHLDYHGDFAAYAQAKRHLFEFTSLQAVVVNGDDPQAGAMAATAAPGVQRVVFGMAPIRVPDAQHLLITGFTVVAGGMQIELDGDLGQASVRLPVIGRFNALNAAAVCAAWHCLGVPFAQACAWLEQLPVVPGRMQVLNCAGAPSVVVDYAHTPDAVASVLDTLRDVARARGGLLWCVIGCGGDRDAGKRALMARRAAERADRLVLTSDNPRSESPAAIVAQMADGLSAAPWLTELDRALAIEAAIRAAAVEDVILVAGKGHESYQEIAGIRYPFSDVAVAEGCLARRQRVSH